MITGGCLCGAVAFELQHPLRPVYACHCEQCRRTSGNYWAATSVPDAALTMRRQEGLRWFQSSETAKRGFCQYCGSSLFWIPKDEGRTVVAAGAIDGQTGLKTKAHIYVQDKGDYYEIADGLPQSNLMMGDESD